jgi:hypothetical protein
MKTTILTSIDKGTGVWVLEYRDALGNVVIEQTAFPASTPSIVVCDELQKDRPQATLFARPNPN